MGIVCSQSIRKLGKHTVAPEHSTKTDPLIIEDVVDGSRDITDNVSNLKAPAAFELPSAQSKASSPAKPRPKKPKDTSKNSSRANSCSDIFTDRFQSPHKTTSSIDTNSILFRTNEISNPKSFKRSASVDSSQSSSSSRFKSSQKISVAPFETCKRNVLTEPESPRTREKQSTNLSKVCRRFGGSFQTLLNSTSNGKASTRSLSASENNLSAFSVSRKSSVASPKRFSTNSDYCPSVLFNRIANKRTADEKNLTLNKWKTYFMVNVLRKKRDTNSRKT